MCSPAQPLPLYRLGANRQAIAWPWLMAARKRAKPVTAGLADNDEPRATRRARRASVLEYGLPAISWRAIAGIATLVGLVFMGVKGVTYTNNLAHSITTLADAVGKLDGTIGTVTSDIVSIKQRMAVYDATQATRTTEIADMVQRQQRMEQAIADLRAEVAAASAGRVKR